MVKRYEQILRIDYIEIFGPMLKPSTIRFVLTFSLSNGWVVRQLDFINVFLNGVLEKDVFMTQVEYFINHRVCVI